MIFFPTCAVDTLMNLCSIACASFDHHSFVIHLPIRQYAFHLHGPFKVAVRTTGDHGWGIFLVGKGFKLLAWRCGAPPSNLGVGTSTRPLPLLSRSKQELYLSRNFVFFDYRCLTCSITSSSLKLFLQPCTPHLLFGSAHFFILV